MTWRRSALVAQVLTATLITLVAASDVALMPVRSDPSMFLQLLHNLEARQLTTVAPACEKLPTNGWKWDNSTENIDGNCLTLPSTSHGCDKGWMQANCAKTCGTCAAVITAVAAAAPAPVSTTATPSAKPPACDKEPTNGWKWDGTTENIDGNCLTLPSTSHGCDKGWMQTNCAKTCGTCTVEAAAATVVTDNVTALASAANASAADTVVVATDSESCSAKGEMCVSNRDSCVPGVDCMCFVQIDATSTECTRATYSGPGGCMDSSYHRCSNVTAKATDATVRTNATATVAPRVIVMSGNATANIQMSLVISLDEFETKKSQFLQDLTSIMKISSCCKLHLVSATAGDAAPDAATAAFLEEEAPAASSTVLALSVYGPQAASSGEGLKDLVRQGSPSLTALGIDLASVRVVVTLEKDELPVAPLVSEKNKTEHTIKLNWNAQNVEPAIDVWEVQYKPKGSTDEAKKTNITGDATSFEATGLKANTKYEFILEAYNAMGHSDASSITLKTSETPLPLVPPPPPKVHGKFTNWTEWTECSAKCGGGERSRTRTCNNPAPADGGDACKGDAMQKEACNTTVCPVKPTAPSVVEPTGKDQKSISIKWAICDPVLGGKISTYKLEATNKDKKIEAEVAGNTSTHTFEGLLLNTEYIVTVKCLNGVGWSPATPPVTMKTTPGIPDVPTPPSAGKVTSEEITLNWSAPQDNGAEITKYFVTLIAPGVDDKEIPVDDLTHTQTDLKPATEYKFKLAARNSVGESKHSAEVAITTLADKPFAPTALKVVTKTSVAATLQCDAAFANGDAVTMYSFEWKESTEVAWTTLPSSSSKIAEVTGLTPATNYTVRVKASNGIGAGNWSSISVKTYAAPPSPVPSSRIAQKAQTTMTFEWAKPEKTNGEPITGYELMWQRDNDPGWHTEEVPVRKDGATYLAVKDLKGGTPYSFKVKGKNSVGFGEFSDVSGGSTDPGPPDVPGMPALVSKSSTHASFSWMLPADNGAPITNFDFQFKEKNGTAWVTSPLGSKTTRSEADLIPNTMYTMRVRAQNKVGYSTYSSTRSVKTDPGKPNKTPVPRMVSYDAREADIAWVDPADNGATISKYEVSLIRSDSPTGKHTPLPAVTNKTGYKLTDLIPATTYSVNVRTKNAVGYGPVSEELTFTTEPDVPDMCKPVKLNLAYARSLRIDWQMPKQNGQPITKYELQYRPSASTSPYTVMNITGKEGALAVPLTAYIESLTPASDYVFRVKAYNSMGWGEMSTDTEVVTKADKPEKPAAVTCSDVRALDLVANFHQPVMNGASLSAWELKVTDEGGAVVIVNPPVVAGTEEYGFQLGHTSTATKPLKPLTEYFLQIRAKNSVGFSVWSDRMDCLTLSDSIPNPNYAKIETTHVSMEQCSACIPQVLDHAMSAPCTARGLSTECTRICDMVKEDHVDPSHSVLAPYRNLYKYKYAGPERVKDICMYLQDKYFSGGFQAVGAQTFSHTETEHMDADMHDADGATLLQQQRGKAPPCDCGPMGPPKGDSASHDCPCHIKSDIFR